MSAEKRERENEAKDQILCIMIQMLTACHKLKFNWTGSHGVNMMRKLIVNSLSYIQRSTSKLLQLVCSDIRRFADGHSAFAKNFITSDKQFRYKSFAILFCLTF